MPISFKCSSVSCSNMLPLFISCSANSGISSAIPESCSHLFTSSSPHSRAPAEGDGGRSGVTLREIPREKRSGRCKVLSPPTVIVGAPSATGESSNGGNMHSIVDLRLWRSAGRNVSALTSSSSSSLAISTRAMPLRPRAKNRKLW